MVRNVHERRIAASVDDVGALIDTLSSENDRLWPLEKWPRMYTDRPLAVGAVGGHGPVDYFVEEYVPSRSITLRFTRPGGFTGYHGFSVHEASAGSCMLRHELVMTISRAARVAWPLFFRPLHDALIEAPGVVAG